jgi:alpha-beta hydrolase superfamily lysophospholipase
MSDFRIIEIPFDSDGVRLHGVLHAPDRPAPPFVIGSHGLFSGADSPKQVRLAETLVEKGIAFFRFDHRGCGQSKGDFIEGMFLKNRAADIRNALNTLSGRADTGGFLGLFGSSMGGAASLSVAATRSVPALVTVAAPVRSREIQTPAPNSDSDPRRRKILTKKRMHFDLSQQLFRVRNILLFHGDADETVPFSHALEIEANTTPPKRLIRLDGGDHRMSDPAHQAVFIREAALWFVQAADSPREISGLPEFPAGPEGGGHGGKRVQ